MIPICLAPNLPGLQVHFQDLNLKWNVLASFLKDTDLKVCVISSGLVVSHFLNGIAVVVAIRHFTGFHRSRSAYVGDVD